jgi:hypothetical protein
VMKAPPRGALSVSAVNASMAPARVSRTVVAGNAGARVVTLDRNSSIAYDAREHKFVNTANPPASESSAKAGVKLAAESDATLRDVAGARTGAAAPAGGVAGMRAPGTPAAARVAAPPAAPRAMTPRAMTPPAPRYSGASAGSGRFESSGRGGGSASSSAPSHSAASHASSSGGHPH